uniref:Platelet endothelial aggregation receptor 1 n=1 Tax=Sinocyclocheilus grahami TaxID=75366 RepID=A0A672RSH4_SINGR
MTKSLFLSSFTTSVKESYAQPFDQVKYEETCFEPWSANKCTRHRITYKTLYRQVVKMDYRRRYQCCRGFYESRNKCVPRCTKECVHGRCVAPDRCQCESGWRGEDCSSSCNAQQWGPGCRQRCECQNGGECDVIKGSCQCPAGYTGEHSKFTIYNKVSLFEFNIFSSCQEPCPAKSFGQGCLQQCLCGTGGSCNKITGECVCRDGFTGTLCPPGRFGPNCAKECLCHNGGHCDPEKGQCQCDAGYTGDRCNEECPVGTYGVDCKGVCDCANGARCYNIHGGCLCEPGFKGPRCDHRMCTDGTYGMHCEHHCLCNSQNTLSCHPLKGECTCQPGWAGLYCNETCDHGYYGNGCLEPCVCVNGGVCDTVKGECHCAPGYTGLHCEKLCENGFYGKGCLSPCTCVNSIACSPIDGTCFCKEGKFWSMNPEQTEGDNCHPNSVFVCACLGWRGLDCSIACSEDTWGSGCNFTCQCANGASCHPADGSCKCTAGWRGASCDEPCPIGTFGPGCQHKCDCLHDEGCESDTGQCLCLPGWTGLRCTQQCPEGTWGLQCNQTCSCLNSATCQAHTGTCLCKPGFWGDQCQHSDDIRCYLGKTRKMSANALKDSCVAVSSSSLNSENPYATIKDLPGLPPCPPESSYMEMKSAVLCERSYTEISPPIMTPSTLSCRGSFLKRNWILLRLC